MRAENHTFSGMSRLAFTKRFRGRHTIRSSGSQPAVGGNFTIADAVMSMPIMAKSPFASFQMSGQPSHPALFAPLACGSGPILRRNSIGIFIVPQQSVQPGTNASRKYQHVAGVSIKLVLPIFWTWQNRRKNANRFYSIGKRLATPFVPTEKRPLSHKKSWLKSWN